MTLPNALKALIIDLDGVLFVDQEPVEGAAEALVRLKTAGLNCRFATNTSTLSSEALHRKLLDMGLPVERHEILSAPAAVHRYLQERPGSSCCLLLAEDIRTDFKDIPQVDLAQADFVVLGDIGDALTRGLLDAVFNRLMNGGQLLAVHKNRFWQTRTGLRMDIGGFVAALEYATGRPAQVMGKPSADFFRIALADLGADSSEAIMVGDDIDADIGGAQRLGIRGVLTRTGKFRQTYVDASKIHPEAIIASFRELPALLGLV